MSFDFQRNFFELFGLPETYRLDERALEMAWHEWQTKVHPDRFAQAGDPEKRRAMQWATRVNEGFRTLREPLARAQYLLELAGEDPGLETNTVMAPEFLVEQMEWREAVEESRAAANADALEKLHRRLGEQERVAKDSLAVLLDDQKDYAGASDTVRRLMFMRKLRREIDEALEALEN